MMGNWSAVAAWLPAWGRASGRPERRCNDALEKIDEIQGILDRMQDLDGMQDALDRRVARVTAVLEDAVDRNDQIQRDDHERYDGRTVVCAGCLASFGLVRDGGVAEILEHQCDGWALKH